MLYVSSFDCPFQTERFCLFQIAYAFGYIKLITFKLRKKKNVDVLLKKEGKMKKIITGIMGLFFVIAIALIPLSVKAEMKVMTDNEMQLVSGQASAAGLVGTGDIIFRSTMLKIGVSPAAVTIVGSKIASLAMPLINNALVTASQPALELLVNFQIPQDVIKALSAIN